MPDEHISSLILARSCGALREFSAFLSRLIGGNQAKKTSKSARVYIRLA